MANGDRIVWEERWKALDESLNHLAARCQMANHRRETLCNLVERFQRFSEKQFYFFYCNLDPKPAGPGNCAGVPAYTLGPSAHFPPDYVLRAIVDQISYDLEVIQRAVESRISGSQRMQDSLDIADKLAWQNLEPAMDRNKRNLDEIKLIDEGIRATVLTYLQKSPSIRLIPYAPVALVGIRTSSVMFHNAQFASDDIVARDLLGTAHEIGHYVYRRGTFKNKPIHRELEDRIQGVGTKTAKDWAEEIFADVYGCLAAGPVVALSGQELALQNSLEDFRWDRDGTHPVPVLRPYIYAKAIQEYSLVNHQRLGSNMANALTMLASDLFDGWKTHRFDRYNGDEFKLKHDGLNGKISNFFSEGSVDIQPSPSKPVDKIISEVVALLKNMEFLALSNSQNQVGSLYPDFKTKTLDLSHTPRFDIELNLAPQTVWEDWIQEIFGRQLSPGETIPAGEPTDIHKEPDRQAILNDDDTVKWIQIAHAAGWTTKIGNHGPGN